jgi:hypothetical protein
MGNAKSRGNWNMGMPECFPDCECFMCRRIRKEKKEKNAKRNKKSNR